MPSSRRPSEPVCSVERCLQILSDRWSFLILREAVMNGITRSPTSNATSASRRTSSPTDLTISSRRACSLTKRSYQEPGSRTRRSYHLTPAGRDLAVPLAALQQWGDEHTTPPNGPTVARLSPDGKTVRVTLLDEGDKVVPVNDLTFARTAAYPNSSTATAVGNHCADRTWVPRRLLGFAAAIAGWPSAPL